MSAGKPASDGTAVPVWQWATFIVFMVTPIAGRRFWKGRNINNFVGGHR